MTVPTVTEIIVTVWSNNGGLLSFFSSEMFSSEDDALERAKEIQAVEEAEKAPGVVTVHEQVTHFMTFPNERWNGHSPKGPF